MQQGIQPHLASMTSITVLEKLGAPVIVAGNKGGFVTLVQQQPSGVKCASFGAYADKKTSDPRVDRVFLLPGSQNVASLGEAGQVRIWTTL